MISTIRNFSNTKKWLLFLFLLLVGMLATIFYLTSRKYQMMQESSREVMVTHKIIEEYQKLSSDFKSGIIYTPSFKAVAPKRYYDVYEQGEKRIIIDLEQLRPLLENREEIQRLDTLSALITNQLSTLLAGNIIDSILSGQKNKYVETVIEIQKSIDREEVFAEEVSLMHIRRLENSLSATYTWLLLLILSSSALILLTMAAILIQTQRREKSERQHLQKIELQNKQLREIAWIQSHKVRSPVASILGLAGLFDSDNVADPGDKVILDGIIKASKQLDDIIAEIDSKTRGVDL